MKKLKIACEAFVIFPCILKRIFFEANKEIFFQKKINIKIQESLRDEIFYSNSTSSSGKNRENSQKETSQ